MKIATIPTIDIVIVVVKMPNKKSLYLFLQFVDLNIFSKTSIDALDCFSKSCMEELVIIGFQKGLLIKSSTSWVIVVIHKLYFLALLTNQNKNLAVSSYWRIFQASSTTKNLFLNLSKN